MDLQQDPELFATFLDEADESLALVGSLFVTLERDPGSRTAVEAIFRPVHSLKGNSAFFGLMTIKRIAHEMESVLDLVRKGKRSADPGAISTLLEGLDLLTRLVGQVRAGGSDEDPVAVEPISQRLTALLIQPESNPAVRDLEQVERALPPEAVDARAAIKRLRQQLGLAGASQPRSEVLLDGLLRKAEAAALDDADTAILLAELRRLQDAAPTPEAKSQVKETIDGVMVFISAMGFDGGVAQYVRERLSEQNWIWFGPGEMPDEIPAKAPASPVPTALESRPGTGGTRPGEPRRSDSESFRRSDSEAIHGGKSMRVAETTIDTFLHYVGELVVVGDMFRHLQVRVVGTPGQQLLARDFRRANETFAGLSNQLQASIMAIRRVSVRPLAQKLPRLVRDVAAIAGKEVEAVVDGLDVAFDKSLIDLLDAPLTHIVRNAVDHGIEPAERRVGLGKPRCGTVKITFENLGSSVQVTITDDGKGLDLEAIRRKADSLGLVAPGAVLSEAATLDLIFASGLSTAKTVTDISGRGVGMDVVKRAVEEAGGTIVVTTRLGQGSEFRMKLPRGVSTQIVGGYLVRAGGTSFVLPLDRVRETFRAHPAERQALNGSGFCLVRRGQLLPLEELSHVLMDRPEPWPARGLPVVVVEANRRRLALAVEAVLGVQKVVIRRLSGLPPGAPMITGAALLGDNRLALVLDLDQLRGERPEVAP